MNPKLIRQYSNILNEAGPYKPPGSYTTAPAQPAGTAAAIRAGQGAKPSPAVGSGASGFPTQQAPISKPVVGPTASRQGGKPSVTPNPNQAAIDAANKVQAGQMAVAQSQTTTGEPTPSATPTPAATPSTAVDPSIGAGQNLAAKAAPSPGVNPFAMKVPDTANDVGQAAKTTPTGLASALTPQGQGEGGTLPAPGQAAKPSSGGLVDGSGNPVTSSDGSQVKTGFSEEELEEELEEMMRLSGLALNEKAVSKQQQKFMGMVHAMQKGEKIKGASPELKKVAKTMGKKDAKDFASTKHKGLPQRVSESVMLEAGSNLEHIVQRFKHETKNFLNGAELDDDLYNALYDYYVDNGEMPYGVAKAREGDPYQWVGDHFESELAMMGHQRQFQETVMPVMDDSLSELARLAGLSESRVDECGDMGMDQQDSMNVSTNMNSNGTKSVTISAQGDQAEALIQMLKLAGMGHMGHDSSSKEPVVMISKDDEEMMDEEYANSPEEEYQTVDSIIRQGNDLNREKRQYADKPKLGDNPMAEEVSLDEELSSLLDSVLMREGDPQRPKGDTGIADIFTADKGIAPPSPDEGPVSKVKPTATQAPKTPASPALPKTGIKK